MFQRSSFQIFEDDVPETLRPILPNDFDELSESVRGFDTDPIRWSSASARTLFWMNHFIKSGWHMWYHARCVDMGYRAHMEFDRVMGLWVWHGLEAVNSTDGWSGYVEKMNKLGRPIKEFIRVRKKSKQEKIVLRIPKDVSDMLKTTGMTRK